MVQLSQQIHYEVIIKILILSHLFSSTSLIDSLQIDKMSQHGNLQPITHTIYLVRHGQCKGNLLAEILPPEDDVITDLGKKQAVALGEHLKDVEFTRAIASTYERAIETAKGIMSKSLKPCPKPLEMHPKIREREMTGIIGMKGPEVDAIRMGGEKNGLQYCEVEISGCESQANFTKRIREFFKELFDELKNNTEPQIILITSHGLTIQRFLQGIKENGIFSDLCVVPNWKEYSRKLYGRLNNTASTIFTINFSEQEEEKPIFNFHQASSTDHLTDELKS